MPDITPNDAPGPEVHQFRDALFENSSADWFDSYSDEHFRQRYLLHEELIYCETLMSISGTTSVDTVVDLIRGPWDWWDHGAITDFVANSDGSSDQILSPVSWFITRVGLHTFPPVGLSDQSGVRVPMRLTEHFTGSTSMDVYSNESRDGLIVRGRFHGVEYHLPAVPNKVAEWLHLDAESGTMPPPFPKGTGWVGLRRMTETGEGASSGDEKSGSG